MTAVVGILNKQAVALAADSAVTISGVKGRKIFNKANKVFTLSKYHPIGVMIYNSASFMSTPWETIIKMYRKQLGDKSCATVKAYQEDFLNYLRSKDFFTTPVTQQVFLKDFAEIIVGDAISAVASKNQILLEQPTDENKVRFLALVEENLIELSDYFNAVDICPEFIDYDFDAFKAHSKNTLDGLVDSTLKQNGFVITDTIIEVINAAVYAVLKAKETTTSYTGLIFSGFGEDEIYPQLIPINISFVVDNKIRYYVDEDSVACITTKNDGAIRPFAQQDVIDTILSGIDPELDSTYLQNFSSIFKKYNEVILQTIGDSNPQLKAQVEALNTDVLQSEFAQMNSLIKTEKYIVPLMNAVCSLSKEDLAEMAESLIYLTYLKRRITFAEESVGGPVDVAIISKGDGFVWIKRKHYFNPELNKHFFENYFNK
ncbi:MAG: hypothetical protein P0Y49_21960 [Candidatus Pedobacter colombiensis]|uniref:Uncharacterized protein n=1 Tax=Candidatus Pedobacter colombiensis TaxID=3121371 RepID=A0AAJ6B8S4_9SPHI|nr:hypothetical protein [Pedobacter sp.]WEK19443.1 MAG: hypothetical protein P0Y49_21960 [Pedobacter sp.]